jgi:hypothetical protein
MFNLSYPYFILIRLERALEAISPTELLDKSIISIDPFNIRPEKI